MTLLISSFAKTEQTSSLPLATILETTPIETLLQTWIPTLCQTSVADLSAKKHAAVTSKTILTTGLVSLGALWLVGKAKSYVMQEKISAFEPKYWIDEKNKQMTSEGIMNLAFIGLITIKHFINFYNFEKPEYLAQEIDINTLTQLNENLGEIQSKIMSGGQEERMQTIFKLLKINPYIKMIIVQLKTIEKYKKDINIQIIVRRLEEQSDYLDSIETLVKTGFKERIN